VLLAFLLTVPFATRFGRTTGLERATLFVCLMLTVAGTVMLMAPSVYHRLRWNKGGKSDVILVAHRLFLIGTSLLAGGIVAAVFLVASVLYGTVAAAASAAVVALTVVCVWYVLPRERSRRPSVRERE
jgi:energy-converting hydrogenase Eha subunit C